MDIKKAKLDDDAAIYNRGPEKTDKQKWAEMNKQERWDFFKSYYLWKVIVLALALFAIGATIYSFAKPKPNVVLQVAVNNFTYVDYSKLNDEYLALHELDPDKNLLGFDIGYSLESDSLSMQRFMVYTYSGDIDMLISGNAVFERYASQGHMQALDELIDPERLAWFEERGLTYTSQIIETDYDGSVLSVGEKHIYGIRLDDITLFNEFTYEKLTPVIGVILTSQKQQEAIDFINFLYDNYSK